MSEKSSELKTVSADVERVEGNQNKVSIRDFEFILDTPKKAGGKNEGPNPVETLLGSLGSCFSLIGNIVADKMNIDLEELEIHVEGDYDPKGMAQEEVPAKVQEVRLTVTKLKGVPEDKKEEFINTVQGLCPVEDSLKEHVDVIVDY